MLLLKSLKNILPNCLGISDNVHCNRNLYMKCTGSKTGLNRQVSKGRTVSLSLNVICIAYIAANGLCWFYLREVTHIIRTYYTHMNYYTTHTHTHTHTHTCTCTLTHTHARAHALSLFHTRTHTHTCTHTHARTHARTTHTHTHPHSLAHAHAL